MQYLFLLYDDENVFHSLDEDEAGAIVGAYMAYSEALEKAGAFIAGEPLDHSRTARRLAVRDGARNIEDGPFTDAKEQLGGFYRIEAKNLDEALDWAARCPGAAHGCIEVRPIWNIGD